MLTVGVADRAEDLVDVLVDHLATPLADPFQAEWVSVPSLGFRSWLRFRLAERLGAGGAGRDGDGIAANIEMPFPGSLRWRVLRAHNAELGVADGSDPWEVERLVWSVIDVMADPASQIHQRLRRAELPTGVTLASRAGPVADLFDRYGVHRPEMVRAWAEGRDVGGDLELLPVERRWQPELYRAVRHHVMTNHDGLLPPAERLDEALSQLRAGGLDLTAGTGPLEPGLPSRLFVVGQSILTAEIGPILDAVATQAEVLVLLLSPSARASVAAAGTVATQPPPEVGPTSWAFPRRHPMATPGPGVQNPLLRVWGRRPLESALLLGAGGVAPALLHADPSAELPQARSLLAHLQHDLHAGAAPDPGADGPGPDGSIQVHAAPGRTRQVEVLRDVILSLLRDHPDLREEDIAVLCPQLDEFGPVISAVLGPSAGRGEQPEPGRVPSLRYAVVDRDARAFNPVLAAMQAVIEAMPGRFDTAGVRDLLHAPAVAERFGLTTEDLGLLSEWMEQTGVRWGLDGPQRDPWRIDPSHHANSWAAGADQLMVGVALGDPLRSVATGPTDHAASPHALAVGAIAPMELAEGSIASAGRLTAAVRTLTHVHHLLFGPAAAGSATDTAQRSAAEWCRVLTEAADLLLATTPFEDWQRAALDDALARLLVASSDHEGEPSATPLTFGDVRRLLASALEGPRARADLGFGSVVFARPALLAGVPFEVVCILGLDDDAMPAAAMGGDDLLVGQPFVGDREPRAEARAELLAALQAAHRHLVITCTSRNVRTNETVPRSVVLDELLDLVEATIAPGSPLPAGVTDRREAVAHDHPRQAFEIGNFVAGDRGVPFSFDPTARDGARAVVARLSHRAPRPLADLLLRVPLDPPADHGEVVALDDLRSFFEHPVKHFFRSRLRITVPKAQEEGDTQLPTTIDKLEGSGIGRDLVAIGMALGDPSAICIDAAGPQPGLPAEVEALLAFYRARGVLPPPAAANPELAAMTDEIEQMLRLAQEVDVLRAADTSHRVEVALPSGERVRGTVGSCCAGDAPGPLHLRYNRFKPKYRVTASIDLLALTAQSPEEPWRSVLICRADSSGKVPERQIRAVAGGDAVARQRTAAEALDVLVAQYRDGQRSPLPLFDATSHAFFQDSGASSKWGDLTKNQWSYRKECHDAHHQLAFGKVDYDDLLELDAGGHTLKGEATRLWGTLAGALVTIDAGKDDAA